MRITILVFAATFYNCTSIRVDNSEKRPFNIGQTDQTKYPIGESRFTISYFVDLDGIDSETIKNATMTVKLISDKNIQLAFKLGDQQISKTFKGRLVDNEFKLRNRLKIKLFPPVFWALIGDSATIYKNTNGDLIILAEHSGVVFLTLMPIFGTSNGRMTGTFKQLQEQ